MKKNVLIILILIGGVTLCGLGFYCGSNYVKKEIFKNKTESPLAVLFSSKVINGLTAVAVGQIKEISGRNLILTAEGSDLTVSVKEDASIGRFLSSGENTKAPQPLSRVDVKFEEIKVGDKVNILCQLKSDLSLEGITLTITP